MKRLILLLVLAHAAFAQNGWTSLFNGKDLIGWKIGGEQTAFQVKDGALVAHGPVAHAFYDGPEKDFKNFELMVDVMAAPNSNGGIYLHTVFQEAGFPSQGFEVQVNNTYNVDPVKTGSLYHVQDVATSSVQDNQWYTTHIVVQGDTITVNIDGKQVVRWTQSADWNGGREGPGRVLSRGTIALQCHDPQSTVAYKNIRIKRLP
jgi:hypothetical protein